MTLRPNARILVVKLAGIGDLLLATPALRALRETYPQAQIDLLVTPASAGILNGWDVINRVIVLDKYLFDYPQQILKHPRNLLRLTPLWHDLHDSHYDAVLLMHHLTLPFGRLKHQLLMRATGARWRVGLDNGHGWFLNVRVPDNGFGAMHEAEYNLALARAIGATTANTSLTVPLSDRNTSKRGNWSMVSMRGTRRRVGKPRLAPIAAASCRAWRGGCAPRGRWRPGMPQPRPFHLLRQKRSLDEPWAWPWARCEFLCTIMHMT